VHCLHGYRAECRPPLEPLSNSEIRVLRYLPTNLSGPEIANELSISPNTVKTHIHNLHMKLGTHRRGEAVARPRRGPARTLRTSALTQAWPAEPRR
jgi:ATP/maltotriose-dependent transcriptional regulator MalT